MPSSPDPTAWFAPGAEMDAAHSALLAELGQWAQAARKSAMAALRDPASQAPAMPAPSLAAASTKVEAPQEQISALRLGLYKLATYRLPATAFTYLVSTIAAGDLYLGGVITFWQSFTHSGVYLGNELAWEWPTPIPTTPFVASAPGRPSGSATRDAVPAVNEAPVRLAANSSQLPALTLPAQHLFAVDGKQVPLPPGSWTVLATSSEDGITGTVLGQTDDNALRGLVVIHSNAAKTTAILGPSAECGRSGLAFAVTRYDTPEDGFCAYGKRVVPALENLQGNPLWAAARGRLAETATAVPATLTMVGARARTQANFLDVRYYFATPPAADLVTAAELGAVLQDWADLVQEPLELGVRGRLRQTAATPWPWDRDAVRLAEQAQTSAPLTALAAAGVIDQANLQHQLAEADAENAAREVQRLSLWSRSFLKVATYRVSAYADTFAVQTFFTASPGQGVAVASVHAVAKPIMAYVNELYWAHSSIGKAPATLLSASFPEIGADQ